LTFKLSFYALNLLEFAYLHVTSFIQFIFMLILVKIQQYISKVFHPEYTNGRTIFQKVVFHEYIQTSIFNYSIFINLFNCK
jgi:hypothetical protein